MRLQTITIIFTLIHLSGINFQSLSQENFEVRRINFQGNKTVDKELLLDNMVLKGQSRIEKVFTKKEPSLYNEELMNVDLERVIRIYQREGFLFAQASLQSLLTDDKKKTVKIIIHIEEGNPVLAGSVEIKTRQDIQNEDIEMVIENINKGLSLIKGERFRDEALKTDIRLIEETFQNMGFAYAKVNYELSLKPEENLTDINYIVDAGRKSQIGETVITGNRRVSEKFIRKQIKYEEGDLYKKSALNTARENLYDLQLFRIVSVSPQKDLKSMSDRIPVNIYVEEAPRLTSRVGAGYGTEDKFRTFSDLNFRGFLGGARRINLYLKHSSLEPYSIQLRWIQPHFPGMKSSISLEPFLQSKSEPGYKLSTYGINVPFTYKFNRQVNSKLTYYFEDVNQSVEPGDIELPGLEDDKYLYSKSGILLSAVFDNSYPGFSPVSGVNLSLGLKVNGYIFGSDFNYTRLWGDFRTYRQFSGWVFAFRVMAGGINSSDNSNFIPVGDRFYSGGSNSIRGWNRAELGPKRESGSPSGGNTVFESNFEVRCHIFWRLDLVGFFEAGNVWKSSYSWNFNNLGYAAGTGIRIETPVGPVRFDAGFPVWNEKKSPQFFISVGQAF